MTNEERQQAIEWLKRRPVTMAGAKRMYDLAVEALEAYVPDTNVGDMISRQGAMERLMAQNVIMEGSEYHNGFNAGVNRAQEVIRNLPSVQQNRKISEWIYGEDDCGQDGWFCSKCRFFVPWYYKYYDDSDFISEYKTCPCCDAKMISYTGKRGEADG